MKIEQGDIIKDGENYFSVFCVVWNVVYVKCCNDIKHKQIYELEEVLKKYRKIEIMAK